MSISSVVFFFFFFFSVFKCQQNSLSIFNQYINPIKFFYKVKEKWEIFSLHKSLCTHECISFLLVYNLHKRVCKANELPTLGMSLILLN